MRLAPALGRLFLRTEAPLCLGPAPNISRNAFRPTRTNIHTFVSRASSRSRPQLWRAYGAARRPLLAAAGGGLAAAAFVELSEKGTASPGDTGENRMLEVSRAEIRKTAGENDGTLGWLRRRVVVFLDLYIWEPVCTGFRFLQLAPSYSCP
jgi:aarF domain-containing kinase